MFAKSIMPVPGSIPRGLGLMAPLMETMRVERQLFGAGSLSLEDKRQKSVEIVRTHVSVAMGTAMVPIPGAGLIGVAGVQLNMLRQLARLYHVNFLDALGRNLIFALFGAGSARIGASMVNSLPGMRLLMGDLSMSLFSGVSTFALGRVMANYFHHGGTLEKIDLSWARNRFFENLEEGRAFVQSIGKKIPVSGAAEESAAE